MIVNYTYPVRRAGPTRTLILTAAVLTALVMAGALHAGSPVAVNEPLNSPGDGTAANKVIAHEAGSEDLVVNLLFHFEQKNGEDAAYTQEVVTAIVEALNKFYRPRGVVFQYETNSVNGSVLADIDAIDKVCGKTATPGFSSESWYNIYITDVKRIQLSSATESFELDYAVIDIGEQATLEQPQLVRDLGRKIALWHTLQNATWLSEPRNSYTDPTTVVGDIDGNGEGPDVADLAYMVDFMFSGGPEPATLQAADVAGTVGIVDIGDLVYLVDYIFQGGSEPTGNE
ncbi:MAG: hypothetical protein KAW46_08650 [candidate division Zixibacteria bacterium]|nr:hypothetical protein [candidate division Zixibacteria bacterium]